MLDVSKIFQDLHFNGADISFAIQILLQKQYNKRSRKIHVMSHFSNKMENCIRYVPEESSKRIPGQNTLCSHCPGSLQRRRMENV